MIEELRKKKSEEEFKECTFSPDINKKKFKKNARSPRPETK